MIPGQETGGQQSVFFSSREKRFRLLIKKQLKQVSSKCGFLPPAPDLPMTSHVESSDQGPTVQRFMCRKKGKKRFGLTFAMKLHGNIPKMS